MKRIAIISLFVFIFAAILVTPSLASTSYQESTSTPTPTATAIPGVTWKVYDGRPDDYDGAEMEDPLDVYLDTSFGYGGLLMPFMDAGIVCIGTYCARRDIYYSIDYSVIWNAYEYSSGHYYEGNRTITVDIQYSPAGHVYITQPCGSGMTFECSQQNINGVIPSTDLYWSDGDAKNLKVTINLGGELVDDTSFVDFHVMLSTDPIDCEDSYIQEDDIASGNIDPKIENPSAITLAQGNKYRLELSGGPWNSTRYDAAFSLDNGLSWYVISTDPTDSHTLTMTEDIECYTAYENGVFVMYFTAPSTTFKIRVNDTAGAFADNTGSLTYRLTNVRAVVGECKSQYSYDPSQDLIGSGSIDLTNQSGTVVGVKQGGFAAAIPAIAGANQPAVLTTNSHYLLVLTGSWQDSSGGLNKNTYQASKETNVWWDFGSSDQETCLVADGSTVEYYFQADGDADLLIRPRSLDLIWSNNTGSVEWAIYGVTYTPRLNVCASTFTLGQLIGSGSIDSTKDSGVSMSGYNSLLVPATGGSGDPNDPPPEDTRYIAVETSAGPWYDNGTMSYWVEISTSRGLRYVPLDEFGECGVWLDKYHMRVYAKAEDIFGDVPDALDSPMDTSNIMKIRVDDQDSIYTNNQGSINYSWYYATKNSVVGDLRAGTCDASFQHAVSATSTIPVNARASVGVYLPSMTVTTQYPLYAIVTTGSWSHTTGGEERYDIEISDDSGATWYDIEDYAGIQCASYISDADHHILAYFMPLSDKHYKVRVNDETSTWTTNPVGTLAVNLYPASGSQDAWATCGSQYSLLPVGISGVDGLSDYQSNLNLLQRAFWDFADWLNLNLSELEPMGVGFPSIVANLPQGVPVGYTFYSGLTYALSTYAGGWAEEGYMPINKTIDVSFNNGDTWFGLDSSDNPYATCVLDLESGYKRVYFTAPESPQVRLRVAGDNFSNLVGQVEYILFAVTGDDGKPLYTSTTVPNWAVSCTTQCTAPQLYTTTSVAGVDLSIPNVDVGAWIAYAGCRIEYFLSWCPEHTAMLINLFSYFKKYEPFGTFYEILELISNAKEEAESYTFVDACSPEAAIVEGGGDPSESVIPMLDENSPWKGGEIVIDQSSGGFGDPVGFEVSSATAECWSGMDNYFGNASGGFLMLIEFTHRAFGGMVYYYIGITFQIFMIGFGLFYLQKRWQVFAW